MANPLDAFTTSRVAGGFKLTPVPKLDKLVAEKGFHGGMEAYDEEMQRWCDLLVRQVNERLQKKDEPATSNLTQT
jgi:hypothetical protein